MYLAMFYVIKWSIPGTFNLTFNMIITVFVVGSISIATTNGGIGIFPLSIALVLNSYGISKDVGLSFGWIMWSSQTILIILLGILAKFLAYKNAKRIIRETKCDAIKIEGGSAIGNIIKYLVSNNIQVMGHVGLLPQSANKFKLKGRNTNEKRKILNDAIEVSRSGAFAIVVECVIEDLAKEITRRISVPTIGIGASKYCDGQILVADDMLGLTNFTPKFVKIYDNLKKNIDKSIKKYSKDVKVRKFPSTKNVYKR